MKYPGDGHESPEFAWGLYERTFNAKTKGLEFQVIGRHVYKHEHRPSYAMLEQLPEDMVGIGSDEFANLSPQLLVNWSVALNDTWLLGGINSLAEFHPASPITWKNILDDQHMVTVTGRELIGLALAGYQEHPLAIGKAFFPPADPKKAEGLRLIAYDEEVCKLTNFNIPIKEKNVVANHAAIVHFFAANSNFTIGPLLE
jgi:hypothetical protein